LLFVAALVFLPPSPADAAEDRAEYRLIFSSDTPRRFHVQADLPVVGNELVMAPRLLAEPLPNGWADFIENLQARDIRGRRVRLRHVGSGRWRLGRPLQRVRLQYDVVLKHDEVKWEVSGLFARAYAVDDAIFFFGHVAFITGDPQFSRPAEISFEVPSGWQAVTALPQVPGKRGVYEARAWDGLILSGSMVGRLGSRSINFGGLRAVITAPQGLGASVDIMSNALRPVIETFVTDLGGAPDGKFGVFFSVTDATRGGETTADTISMLFRKAPDLSEKLSLYVIAHEIFHLWNAVAIAAENAPETYWFAEGFTSYGALLGMYRTGLMTEAEFLEQIALAHDRYLTGSGAQSTPAGQISMTEAGKEKMRNYHIIYDGGLLVALALDIEAKMRCSDPQAGFLPLMRQAFEEFGKTGKRYTQADLRRLASESIGAEATPIFERYIEGRQVLHIGEHLRKVGFLLTTSKGKSSIVRDPAITSQTGLYPTPLVAATRQNRPLSC
jgi:predicted metalloprotease with PDZ domain